VIEKKERGRRKEEIREGGKGGKSEIADAFLAS